MRFLRPAGGVSNLKSACFTTSLQQYDSEISPLSSHLHYCILRVSDSSIVQHSDVVNAACLQMSAVNMQHLDTTFNIDSATALRSSRLLLHDEKTIEHPLSKAIAARNEMACACISCAAFKGSEGSPHVGLGPSIHLGAGACASLCRAVGMRDALNLPGRAILHRHVTGCDVRRGGQQLRAFQALGCATEHTNKREYNSVCGSVQDG